MESGFLVIAWAVQFLNPTSLFTAIYLNVILYVILYSNVKIHISRNKFVIN